MNYQNDIGFLVHMIGIKIENKANRELDVYQITAQQGRFLAYLNQKEGLEASQKELQNHFGISHPTAAGIVKRLEQKGFITSRCDKSDKRRKIIKLTPKEKELNQRMMEFGKEMEKTIVRDLTENEHKMLVHLLQRVHFNLI